MDVLLLAAGLGTRLKPLSDELPKPLMPIGNRAIIERTLNFLAKKSVDHVVINSYYQNQILEAQVVERAPEAMALTFSRETTLLGTGGGIAKMLHFIPKSSTTAIVMNADILFQPDLTELAKVHERSGAVATMILRPRPAHSSATSVGIDAQNRVVKIGEISGNEREPIDRQDLMFTGVQILSREAFADLPEQGCIIQASYRRWLEQDRLVQALIDDSYWFDIGTIRDYHRANMDWLKRKPVSNPIHESAKLSASASVNDSCVGANAKVCENVQLERCVVWPDAIVSESQHDAIITPQQVVRLS